MGYLALTGGEGYLSGSPHRSMMGTLIACGTGEVLPTTNSILCHSAIPAGPGMSSHTPRHLEGPHSGTFSSPDLGDRPAAVQ